MPSNKPKQQSVKPNHLISSTSPVKTEQEPSWQQDNRKQASANLRHPLKLKADENNKLIVAVEPKEMFCRMYETTGFTDFDAAEHLTYQVANSNTRGNEGLLAGTNASLAIMNGIAPENPLEGILAAQMTVAHNMAMEFSRRAMSEDASVEAVERNVNRATKMMKTFTAQVEALHKLRNKGQQKIIVQHVQVNQGGQAVIGDINARSDK